MHKAHFLLQLLNLYTRIKIKTLKNTQSVCLSKNFNLMCYTTIFAIVNFDLRVLFKFPVAIINFELYVFLCFFCIYINYLELRKTLNEEFILNINL